MYMDGWMDCTGSTSRGKVLCEIVGFFAHSLARYSLSILSPLVQLGTFSVFQFPFFFFYLFFAML